VSALRKKINQLGHSVSLSVDGGINRETANKSVQAGANILVAGSSVFQLKGVPYSKAIEQLRNP
jgi:ribulose-phosphate 3-epimerase